MAAKPLYFLHAANLQLDCPLRGVGHLEDDIREIVDAATLIAFERLITTCIDKDVDALLITGNTFDASYPSLAAEVALREGFNRLAERQIPVFITPGPLDPAAAWNDLPAFPDNVSVFTDIGEEPVDLTDHGHLMATLFPITAEASVDPEELSNILGGRTNSQQNRPFVIGLLLTERSLAKKEKTRQKQSRFSALDWLLCPSGVGSESLPLTDGIVHPQASAQGLSHSQTGIHGATLLEIDAHRKTKRTLVPLAPVRWERLTQSIDGARGRDELLERMQAQLERLPHSKGEQVRIIDWKLDRTSADAHGWEQPAAAKELGHALTELSDQPDGLRYVHRVHALEPDLTLVEPGHREVLTEYLLALERRPAVNPTVFAKWLADAHVGNVLKPGSWEQWTESLSPSQVTQRAQQLGWKWFTSISKK